MTTPPAPLPSASHQNGINIRDAFSILSVRAEKGNVHLHEITDSSSVPNELKEMGQRIDIAAVKDQVGCTNTDPSTKNDVVHGCPKTNNDSNVGLSRNSLVNGVDDEEEKKHHALKRERERRAEEIRTKLQSMCFADLLGTIFQAQEERVATYKMFEGALSKVLASGNMTDYPTVCAKVTASFSVLSDSVNSVKSTLEHHNRRAAAHFVAELQKVENEKLNLTAALHLERLRSRNALLERATLPSSEAEDRTVHLLKDGIRSLERKIAKVVETINEMLDELRCIAADA